MTEEHYKNKADYLDKRELELLAEIKELEKLLQESAMHNISVTSQADDHYALMQKYKQVLQSIANEQVELSHDKIKWQCEDHIRWAKEVLE